MGFNSGFKGLNLARTNVMKFITKNSPRSPLHIAYKGECTEQNRTDGEYKISGFRNR